MLWHCSDTWLNVSCCDGNINGGGCLSDGGGVNDLSKDSKAGEMRSKTKT